MAQLTRLLNCILIFDKDVCVIQDRTSKSLIGVGQLRGGIHCLKEFANIKIQAFTVGSCNFWQD